MWAKPPVVTLGIIIVIVLTIIQYLGYKAEELTDKIVESTKTTF